MKHVKSIEKAEDGCLLINGRVLIDPNGILWNAWYSRSKPYKDFPKYYFDLRDKLIKAHV